MAGEKMTVKHLACILSLVALCSGGCLELVRRPNKPIAFSAASDSNAVSPAPATLPGNSTPEADVQVYTEQNATALLLPQHRSNKEQRAIKQVNEYALWCIDNEMWNEARSHMEHALAKDSLSASLHNNLGIVYERLGQADKAARFYQRALALSPGKNAYQANLQKLQNRQTFQDTSGDFDLFRLDDKRQDRRGNRRNNHVLPALIGE
jgi:tetratricopeptide (TPR) repeat protein